MDTFENNSFPEEASQPPIPPEAENPQSAHPEQSQGAPQEPYQVPPQADPYAYRGAGTGRRESPYANSPYMQGQYSQGYQNQYQDRQGPYQPDPPYQGYQQYQYQPQTQKPSKPRKEKKPGKGKRVLAILLVVAVLGGVCGGFAWNLQRLRNRNEALDQEIVELHSKIAALESQQKSAAASGGAGASIPAGDGMTPGQLYQACVDSVVAISSTIVSQGYYGTSEGAASGSGFILSEDGYIVTNYHVVEEATSITVVLHDGTEYEAELVGKDAGNDVAVLKTEAQDLPAAKIGSSDALVIGDMVAAIGNPLGELTATQTIGYVSGIGREVSTDNTIISMIQTDAAINPGNSGGPLFNMYGEVIGITTAKYSGTTGSGASIEGIGFAIPIDDIKGIIADLIDYGYVTGAYLGVTVENIDSAMVSKYGLPTGAYVRSVEPGFAAQRAGIQVKDIIVDLGGHSVTSITDLTRALRNFKADDTTTITVVRGGNRITLDITLDEKPQTTPDAAPEAPTAPSSDDMMDAFRRFFGG